MQFDHLKRREFITLLGGTAVTWPVAARAQPSERVRRIGVFMPLTADDAEAKARNETFLQELQRLGWTAGRNMQIDYRWGAGDTDRYGIFAAELVALGPDVILVNGSSIARAVQRVTRTVPIVFAQVADPVSGGLVESLARPGGNMTGFTQFEYGTSAKWLELLKQIAPDVKRAAVVRDSAVAASIGQMAAMQSMAPSLGIELSPVGASDAGEIESAMGAFARGSNGGLIVTAGALPILHRDLIITLAARHHLPAVYPYRIFAASGGLVSYGADQLDRFRRAAGYVDRILKGEKPTDLPVQQPTKFGLVINLKTAKALGLEVPPMLLARADEVIE